MKNVGQTLRASTAVPKFARKFFAHAWLLLSAVLAKDGAVDFF